MEIRRMEKATVKDAIGLYDLSHNITKDFKNMEIQGVVSIDGDFVNRLHAVAHHVYGSSEYVTMLYDVNALHDIFHLPLGFILILPQKDDYEKVIQKVESAKRVELEQFERPDNAAASSVNGSNEPQVNLGKGKITISSKRNNR